MALSDLVVINKDFLFILEFGPHYTTSILLTNIIPFSFIHKLMARPSCKQYNGDICLTLGQF